MTHLLENVEKAPRSRSWYVMVGNQLSETEPANARKYSNRKNLWGVYIRIGKERNQSDSLHRTKLHSSGLRRSSHYRGARFHNSRVRMCITHLKYRTPKCHQQRDVMMPGLSLPSWTILPNRPECRMLYGSVLHKWWRCLYACVSKKDTNTTS